MYLNFANSLASLLAFSQALWAVQAYPSQHDDSPAHILPAQEGGPKSSDINIATTPLSKRNPTFVRIAQWGQGPGTTWSGYVNEPANSGWRTTTIDNFAYSAWKQTQEGTRRDVTLVAALWIRGQGVYLGSIPHGNEWAGSRRVPVQAMMERRFEVEAKVMWHWVRGRRVAEGKTKWHAEDMAMYTYEQRVHPQPRGPSNNPNSYKYPDGSYMAIYGQYNGRDTPGFKRPCGGGSGESANIVPSCTTVLQNIGITARSSG